MLVLMFMLLLIFPLLDRALCQWYLACTLAVLKFTIFIKQIPLHPNITILAVTTTV